jgi:hypothetical protein
MKNYEMGGTCRVHYSENLKGKCHLGSLGVHRRIVFRYKIKTVYEGVNWI